MFFKKIINTDIKILLMPLLLLIVMEVVIGGGGHFTAIGNFTLRMAMYLLSIPIAIVYILVDKKLPKYVLMLTSIFTFLLILATVIALINQAETEMILEDIKQLLFFYTLLFFSITIVTLKDIEKVTNIVKYSSLILAFCYVIFILLLYFGFIDFMAMYTYLEPIGEIKFRGTGYFIYKGFLFLCIGFLFFVVSNKKNSILFALFLFTSVILTFTRGFVLATIFVFAIHLIFINRNKLISIVILALGLVLIAIVLPFYLDSLGNKFESDIIRVIQIEQVLERTDLSNFFIGHGFGTGVEIRKDHFEISYLEIFAKQGIIGLMFWFGIGLYILIMFLNLRQTKEYFTIAIPFFLGTVFIFLQSFTNPYLNNAIGMSFILLTVVIFNRLNELAKNERKVISNPENKS